MTRIVRRIAGAAVLLAVLSLAGPAEAAGRASGQGMASPGWGQLGERLWQRVVRVMGLRPAEEDREKKGAGIDPNGATLNDPLEPILTKKGAGVDPNG